MVQLLLAIILLAGLFYAFYLNFKQKETQTALGFALLFTIIIPPLLLAFLNLILKIKLDSPITYLTLIILVAVAYYNSKTGFLEKISQKAFSKRF
ncbi:MAG: hypothetical protein ABH803_03315 [Candidatus Micrarchaeota archaeon]